MSGVKRLPSVRTDAEAWAIVTENTRLVWWLINRRYRTLDEHEREDAYSFGVLGLFRAAQLWDPAKGTLGTYAPSWIHQAIQRGFENTEERRAKSRGEDPPRRPISLDQPLPGTDMQLADVLADEEQFESDVEWQAVLNAVRSQCSDAIDHALLDHIERGDERFAVGVATAHGRSHGTAAHRMRRLRHLLASELDIA